METEEKGGESTVCTAPFFFLFVEKLGGIISTYSFFLLFLTLFDFMMVKIKKNPCYVKNKSNKRRINSKARSVRGELTVYDNIEVKLGHFLYLLHGGINITG